MADEHRDTRRRGLRWAVVAVGVLAAASIGSMAPANASNPGGCNNQKRGPFIFTACVNGPNFATVQSDGYIDAKPGGCFDIRIDLRDKHGDLAKAGDWQSACGTGHYLGASLGFWDNNHNNPWFSQFTIVQGTDSYVIDSPYIG